MFFARALPSAMRRGPHIAIIQICFLARPWLTAAPNGFCTGSPPATPQSSLPPATLRPRPGWMPSRSCRLRRAPASPPARSIATFPSKTELVAALVDGVAEREVAAIRQAAEAAPGPLSALAAGIVAFAARALRERRLACAVLSEPSEPAGDTPGLRFRTALIAEFAPTHRRCDRKRASAQAGRGACRGRAGRRAHRRPARPAGAAGRGAAR